MKAKTIFYCTDCGNETAKWSGQCPACRAWNTLVEQPSEPKKKSGAAGKSSGIPSGPINHPKAFSMVETTDELRFETGMSELDRVLGGGAVKGSLVLVGGAPGIGKSTLMLQICSHLSRFATVLYVSGEESERQIKLRAERLKVHTDGLFLLAETNLDPVFDAVHELKPDILIVDSIQTMSTGENTSSPGSIGQIKECTMALMQLAKGEGITVFVIGHVNKEGALAGPKVLEHMVDCVLYFEGEEHNSYRILRAAKNRFGATNEIGVFEMGDKGLVEVENPSLMLLSGRPLNVSGSCVACTIEGTRPMLAEVQGLVSPTGFGNPRRMATGFDYNRLSLLLAVLEKRAGYFFSNLDTYVNVVGGLELEEPAVDLPIALALISGLKDTVIPSGILAFGEVGLTGEIRAVSNADLRVSEAARMGFKCVIVPQHNLKSISARSDIKVIGVRTIREAYEVICDAPVE